MKTAILYRTHHGTTARVAELIAQRLRENNDDDVTLLDLGKNHDLSIDDFDRLIIGGSIHIGMIQKSLRRFCEKNLEKLLQKDLGLFICCMLKDKQQEQFENAFPEVLRTHSQANAVLGGELLFERMNCLEKFIVKKVAKTNKSSSQINIGAISHFVNQFVKGENAGTLICDKVK